MKKNLVCNNCGLVNPLNSLTCSNCKSFLRERVVNIDLFKILARLIESPVNAFTYIIHSENKNYIFLVLFLISIKILINSFFIAAALGAEDYFSQFLIKYIILLLTVSSVILLFSIGLKQLNKSVGIATTLKDNFSVLVYSYVPYIYGILILFPVELIIFGDYLFSNNPSPFFLKETLAYTLLGFEVLLILWSLFLSICALYSLSGKIKYGITTGIIFQILIFLLTYFFPITF
jgi:hypothetical protein